MRRISSLVRILSGEIETKPPEGKIMHFNREQRVDRQRRHDIGEEAW